MKKYEKIFRKSLEVILLEADLITQEQAEQVAELKIESGDMAGNILLDMGLVSENDIVREISKRFQIPYLDLPNYMVPKQVLDKVDKQRKVLHKHQVFPVDEFGDTLALTLSQSLSSDGFREIQSSTTMEVMFYVSKISHVRKALDELLPFDAKLVEQERKKKAATAQPNTWTDIFDTANKNIMKGLTRKQENPFRSGS